MRLYAIRIGPKSSDWCPVRRGNVHTQTHTQRKGHVKTEAERGGISKSQGLPRIVGSYQKVEGGEILPQSLRGNMNLWYLCFGLLASRTVWE